MTFELMAQRPGPLCDWRMLADCCGSTAPAPQPSEAPPVSPAKELAEYLDLKELALYSRIGLRTLRGYIHRKVRPLPSYQIGKKILVRRVEFDGWLASFQRAERVDEVGQAVDEILSGLTTPSPRGNTRAHPHAESVARGRHGAREGKRLGRVLGLRHLERPEAGQADRRPGGG